MTSEKTIYAKPEVLLGDLRGGLCSSGLCRQLRAVSADEIERLRAALQGIATNELSSTTSGNPSYVAGIKVGLSMAADMAKRALGVRS